MRFKAIVEFRSTRNLVLGEDNGGVKSGGATTKNEVYMIREAFTKPHPRIQSDLWRSASVMQCFSEYGMLKASGERMGKISIGLQDDISHVQDAEMVAV